MSDDERFVLDLFAPCHGVFSVDGEGRIWRHKVFTRTGNTRPIEPRRADPASADGYRHVRVNWCGRAYHAQAHRIVWIAAHGAIPEGLEPNHKNGLRGDNHLSNLELLTKSGNLKHAYDVLGRHRASGERNGRHKLTADQVTDIRRRLDDGEPKRALARAFSISPLAVRKIASGQSWKAEDCQEIADPRLARLALRMSGAAPLFDVEGA